jgi:hypothetical protein
MNVATLDRMLPQAAKNKSLLKLLARRFLIVKKLTMSRMQPIRDMLDTTRSMESRARPCEAVRLSDRGMMEREKNGAGDIVDWRIYGGREERAEVRGWREIEKGLKQKAEVDGSREWSSLGNTRLLGAGCRASWVCNSNFWGIGAQNRNVDAFGVAD